MDYKEIFGEELAPKIEEKLADKYEIREKSDDYITFKKSEGSFIPISKFNELNQEKKSLQSQFDDLNNRVGNLDELSKDNEALKAELDKIRTESETFKTQMQEDMRRTRVRSAIQSKIMQGAGENTDLIMAKYFNDNESIDKIPVVNDEIVGFEELMKPIVEKHKGLFNQGVFSGTPPADGDPGGDPIDGLTSDDKKLAQATGMGETAILEIKKENKEKYEQLKKIYKR